jgi:hypothetical protein
LHLDKDDEKEEEEAKVIIVEDVVGVYNERIKVTRKIYY